MTAAIKWDFISETDYLAGELASEIKHEFREGIVYAMAGGSNVHNRIAMNALGFLFGRLKRHPCDVFNSDTKVRTQMPNDLRFYYPDALVTCDSNPPEDSFQEKPRVVLEVISESTRRIDEGEKKEAYFSIPSLDVYILVEQDQAVAKVWRRQRHGGFEREIFEGLDAVIPLTELETELPLMELYDKVEFPEEAA